MLYKFRGEESKFHQLVKGRTLSRADKGQIAEAAVLFRLAIHGLHVLTSVFDGGRSDWIVETPSRRLCKLQVKWARRKRHGLPVFYLTCSDGRGRTRRYREGEFDFLTGYDLFTDTVYVFTWDELASNKDSVTVREDASERWDKILGT